MAASMVLGRNLYGGAPLALRWQQRVLHRAVKSALPSEMTRHRDGSRRAVKGLWLLEPGGPATAVERGFQASSDQGQLEYPNPGLHPAYPVA